MTDGTSQGLFIVVAIVIFGIFVVMAYILFEDTLSPALASMFTDATETSQQKLLYDKSLYSTDDLTIYTGYAKDFTIIDKYSFSVTRNAVPTPLLAASVPENIEMESNGIYTVSGYMFVDGEPVTYNQWSVKGFSNAHTVISFEVDNDTGYFESTMKITGVTSGHGDTSWFRRLVFHATILNKQGGRAEGEVLTVKDFRIQKGDTAYRSK